MTANERRIKIMTLLYRRGNTTSVKLAEEFGVSRSTIMRDIVALSMYNPIYTVQGRNGGGIYILKDGMPEYATRRAEENEVLDKVIAAATSSCAFVLEPKEIEILYRLRNAIR